MSISNYGSSYFLDYEDKIQIVKYNEVSIPDDCLIHVLLFCEPIDVLLSYQRVCKSWKQASDHDLLGLEVVKEIVSKVLKNLPRTKKRLTSRNNFIGTSHRTFAKSLVIEKFKSDCKFPVIQIIQEIEQTDRIEAPSTSGLIAFHLLAPLIIGVDLFEKRMCFYEGISRVINLMQKLYIKKEKEVKCLIQGKKYLTDKTIKIEIIVLEELDKNRQKQVDMALKILKEIILKEIEEEEEFAKDFFLC